MATLDASVIRYQSLLREEKVALLRLPPAREEAVELLIELQSPTRQRRISAMQLTRLVIAIERNLSDPEAYIDDFNSLKLSLESWNRLRVAGEKCGGDDRRTWDKKFEEAAGLRNEILESCMHIVPVTRRRLNVNNPETEEDLGAVGIVAIIRAMETFSSEHGKLFENYARIWVMSLMLSHLRRDKLVVPSDNATRLLSRYQRAVSELSARLGREPEDIEIAEELGVSLDAIEQITGAKVRTMSLDASAEGRSSGEEEGMDLHELIGVEAQEEHSGVELAALRERIEEVFSSLSVEERLVLSLCIGVPGGRISGSKPRPLEEIRAMITRGYLEKLRAALGSPSPSEA